MDDGQRLRELHQLCVLRYREGNASHWKSMFIAYTLSGKYERGMIAGLAADLCLEDSTVYGWVDGVKCLRALSVRDKNHRLKFPDIRKLRRILKPSHFIVVGELWRKLEFSDIDAYNYLKTSAENGISVNKMRSQIKQANGDPPEWRDRLEALTNKLVNLAVDKSVPAESQRVIGDVQAILSRAAKSDEPAWVKRTFALLHMMKQLNQDQETPGDLLAWVNEQVGSIHRLLAEWDCGRE